MLSAAWQAMEARNFSSIKKSCQAADCRQKAILPPLGGRIALSANERIAEFLDFAIQAKFAYVNKQKAVKLKPICRKTTNLVFSDTCG